MSSPVCQAYLDQVLTFGPQQIGLSEEVFQHSSTDVILIGDDVCPLHANIRQFSIVKDGNPLTSKIFLFDGTPKFIYVFLILIPLSPPFSLYICTLFLGTCDRCTFGIGHEAENTFCFSCVDSTLHSGKCETSGCPTTGYQSTPFSDCVCPSSRYVSSSLDCEGNN